MSENLVIVESPAKSKTIEKYLGDSFRVISTVGHLRNLPSKQGIDVNNNYQMNYELIERDHNKPQQIISDIKKALKTAKKLYLATDQDREGEVIAWHLIDILEKENALSGIEIVRIVFNEITYLKFYHYQYNRKHKLFLWFIFICVRIFFKINNFFIIII